MLCYWAERGIKKNYPILLVARSTNRMQFDPQIKTERDRLSEIVKMKRARSKGFIASLRSGSERSGDDVAEKNLVLGRMVLQSDVTAHRTIAPEVGDHRFAV